MTPFGHREDYDGRTPTDCICDGCGRKRAEFLLAECKTDDEGRAALIRELIAERDRLEQRLGKIKRRVAMYV